MIFSSNDKLIDEVRKRLLEGKKKNYYNYYKVNGINFQDTRRISTLAQRRSSISRRSSIKVKTSRNLLAEDKINLRLVPVIKSVKAIMRLRKDNNDNHKRYNTEANTQKNSSRYNFNTIKSKINSYSNSNSNVYMTTFSNGLSTSNSFGKTKIFKKRHLFLSPFQLGKNKKKMFKNLVDISKEMHSPKNKENNLVNNIFNISSLKRFNDIKTNKDKKKENVRISERMLKLENSFFHDQKEKMRYKSINKKKKNRFLLEELSNGSQTLKRLMKNEKKRRPNCYYNKLHLNKIHDIIEKYSYNNKD
jgi:hypothetical protein